MDNILFKRNILIFLSALFFFVGIGISIIPEHMFTGNSSILSVTLLSAPALWGLVKMYGYKGLLAVIVLGFWALLIETIGLHTGFPYSGFEYVLDFGYRLFDTTPWTVFIAWTPFVIGSFLFAQNITKKTWLRLGIYLSILVGADLVLDPGAVARGLWRYFDGGVWFGVPYQNFLGWIFSGLVAYMILVLFFRKVKKINYQYVWIGVAPLTVSVLMWAGVNIGYGLYVPGFFGIVLGLALLSIFSYINKILR